MSLIVRSMLPNGDKPAIGPSAKELGVRVAPAEHPDLPVDPKGKVFPKTGGMSVAPDWRLLPLHRIPMRLNRIVRDAKGNNRLVCWRLGNLPFIEGPVSSGLALRTASPTHGLIEPSMAMPLKAYTDELVSTRDMWVKVDGIE